MRRIHRFIICVMAAFLILSAFTCTRSSALSEQLFITVKINGQPIFVDANPYVRHQRTYVPIRFVAEAFNMEVDWIQDEKKAVLKNETTTIEMWIDSNRLLVNGEEKLMDVCIEGVGGRTMVPIRHFAEILDFTVRWDDLTCSVELVKESAEIPASSLLARSYTDMDLLWLARIVDVEAHNLGIDAKVAVANVVLNRTKSEDFPGTIYDVIFDTKYSKQFPPAHRSGFADRIPGKTSVIAAKMALEGINNIDKCLFFNDEPFKGKKDDLYKVIDGEYFYY
jgi:N-acetylmuramoyl-L-alanine amidase